MNLTGIKLTEIKPVFCLLIPEHLEYGFIYISQEYSTSSHLCACGCGQLTILPIGDPDKGEFWSLTVKISRNRAEDLELVSFNPSVGNHHSGCPTKAHYHITKNKIVWY